MLEKTLESPLYCTRSNQSILKGNSSEYFGRTDAEAETPIFSPPDGKNWLIWKDPDAGKDWWREEKGTTEDEMAGWHHRLNGCESEWTQGVGDGQGGLACCGSWSRKESDTMSDLTELNLRQFTNVFVPWFSHLRHGENKCLVILLWGLHEQNICSALE